MKRSLRKRIGKNLLEARTDLGLTQQELASRVRISRGFVSEIENGSKAVGLETFFKLCAAVELEPERALV